MSPAAAMPSLSMAGAGAGASLTSAYGIDAPLAPPAPKPAPRVPNKSHSLDLDLAAASTPRQPAPVSPSLVDAITRLRAESDPDTAVQAAAVAPVTKAPAPAPVAAAPVAPAPVAPAPVALTPMVAAVEIAPEILAAPEPTSLLLEPSIFMPTPFGGVSIINPDGSTRHHCFAVGSQPVRRDAQGRRRGAGHAADAGTGGSPSRPRRRDSAHSARRPRIVK